MPFDVDSRETLQHLRQRLERAFGDLTVRRGQDAEEQVQVQFQTVGDAIRATFQSPFEKDDPFTMQFFRARRSARPGHWGWAFQYSFGGSEWQGEIAEQGYIHGLDPFRDLVTWSTPEVMPEYIRTLFEEPTIRSSTGMAGRAHKLFSEGFESRSLPGAVMTAMTDDPTSLTPFISDAGRSILAQRPTIGVGRNIRDVGSAIDKLQQITRPNNRYLVDPSQAAFWEDMGPFVPYKADSRKIRMTPANLLPSPLEGDIEHSGLGWIYQVLAPGTTKLPKHRTVAEGLRPNIAGVGVFRTTRDPKIIEHKKPTLIQRGTEEGLTRLNIKGFGEFMPPAQVFRDRVTAPFTPMPGANIIYEDVMREAGAAAILYPKEHKRKLYGSHEAHDPMNISEFRALDIEFGVFKQDEEGRWVKTDQQLEGRSLSPRESITYGVITRPTGEQMPLIYTQDEREGAIIGTPQVLLGPSARLGADEFAEMTYAFQGTENILATGDIAPEDREAIERRIQGGDVVWEGGRVPTIKLPVGVASAIAEKGLGRKSGQVWDVQTIGKEIQPRVRIGEDLFEYSSLGEPPKNPLVAYLYSFWGTKDIQTQARFIEEAFPEYQGMIDYARGQAAKEYIDEGQIDLDVLWREYAKQSEEQVTPWGFLQHMQQRTANLYDMYKEQGREADFYRKFQYAEAQEQRMYAAEIPGSERAYYTKRAEQAALEEGMTRAEARAFATDIFTFQHVKGTDRYRMYQKTAGQFGAIASSIVPEQESGRLLRLGHQERLALLADFPIEAEMLGLSETAPIDSTGLSDPAVEGWRTLRDYVSYQFSGYEPRVSPGSEGVEYTTISPEEAANIIDELSPLSPEERTLERMQEAVERWVIRDEPIQGLLRLQSTEELQPAPRVWGDVSKIDYSPLGAQVPISRAAKAAPGNFMDWVRGARHQGGAEGTNLFYQAMNIYDTLSIAGSNIIKAQQQRVVPGHWGHLTGVAGIGPHEAVMPYDEMRSAILAQAEAQGVLPRGGRAQERFIRKAFEGIANTEIQLSSGGGFTMRGMPLFGIANPTYGRLGSVLPMMARTPKMFREQENLNIPDPTVFNRSGVTAGSLNLWGYSLGVSNLAERAMRDFDVDPFSYLVSMQFDEEGNVQWAPTDAFRRSLDERGIDALEATDEILSLMMGGESAGRNVLGIVGGISDHIKGMYGPQGAERFLRGTMMSGLTDTTSEQVWRDAFGYIQTKWEMGSAYNTRRLYEAAWGSMGHLSEENVDRLYTAMATSYGKALEIAESTGNPLVREHELLLQSLHFKERNQGGLKIGWKFEGQSPDVWRGHSAGKGLFYASIEAFRRDYTKGLVSPEEIFGVFAMSDEDFTSMMEDFATHGGSPIDIVKEYAEIGMQQPTLTGEAPTYDIFQTIQGKSILGTLQAKTFGLHGKRSMRVGDRRVQDILRETESPIEIGGETLNLFDVLQDPTLDNLNLRYSYFTRTDMPMTIEERYKFEEDYQRKLERIKAGEEGVHIDRITELIRKEQATEQAYRTIEDSGAVKGGLLAHRFWTDLEVSPHQMAGLTYDDLGRDGQTSRNTLRDLIAKRLFGIHHWHEDIAVRDKEWYETEYRFKQGRLFEEQMADQFVEETGWLHAQKPRQASGRNIKTPMGTFSGKPDIVGIDPETGAFTVGEFKWAQSEGSARRRVEDSRGTRPQLMAYASLFHSMANPLEAAGISAEEWDVNQLLGGRYGTIEEGGERKFFHETARQMLFGNRPVTEEQQEAMDAYFEAIRDPERGIRMGVSVGQGDALSGFSFYQDQAYHALGGVYTTQEAQALYKQMMSNLMEVANPSLVADVWEQIDQQLAANPQAKISDFTKRMIDLWGNPFFRENELGMAGRHVSPTQTTRVAQQQAQATQDLSPGAKALRDAHLKSVGLGSGAGDSSGGLGAGGLGGLGGGGSLPEVLMGALRNIYGGEGESYMMHMMTTEWEDFMAQESAWRARVAADQTYSGYGRKHTPAYENLVSTYAVGEHALQLMEEAPTGIRSLTQAFQDMPVDLAEELYDILGEDAEVRVLRAGEGTQLFDSAGNPIEIESEKRRILAKQIAAVQNLPEGEQKEKAKAVLQKYARTSGMALGHIKNIQKMAAVGLGAEIDPKDLPSTAEADIQRAEEISGMTPESESITPIAIGEILTGQKLDKVSVPSKRTLPRENIQRLQQQRFEERVIKEVQAGRMSQEEALDLKSLSDATRRVIEGFDAVADSANDLAEGTGDVISRMAKQRQEIEEKIETLEHKAADRMQTIKEQEAMGLHGEEARVQAQREWDQYQAKISDLRDQRQLMLKAEEEGLPGDLAQGMRKLFGGFGIFYMSRLASLSFGQFRQGQQERLRFDKGMADQMIGLHGAGAVDPLDMFVYAQERAALQTAGGTWGQMQRLRANMSGFSDVLGSGLFGIGTGLAASHLGGAFAGSAGILGKLGALTTAAPAIGLVAGLGMAGFSIHANAQDYDQSLIRVAAQETGGWSRPFAQLGAAFTSIGPMAVDRAEIQRRMLDAGIDQGEINIMRHRGYTVDQMAEWARERGIDIPPTFRELTERYTGVREAIGRQELDLADFVGMSLEDQLAISKVMAMEPLKGWEGISPTTTASVFARLGTATQALPAGEWEEIAKAVAMSLEAGIDTPQIAQQMALLQGRGIITPGDAVLAAGDISRLPVHEQQRIQAGLGKMGQIPGAQRMFYGWGDERIQARAEQYERVVGSGGEAYFDQQMALNEMLRPYGLATPISPAEYERGYWAAFGTPEREQQELQDIAFKGMQSSLVQRMTQAGIGSLRAGAFTGAFADMGMQGLAFQNRLMNLSPTAMAEMSQMMMLEGNIEQARWFGQFAVTDTNLRGDLTGLGLFQTSMQGLGNTAIRNAFNVFGEGWHQRPSSQAATFGIDARTGRIFTSTEEREQWEAATGRGEDVQGGIRGLQIQGFYQQVDYQRQQMAQQWAGFNLQQRYQPLFWGLEDRQRELGYRQQELGWRQQEWGFDRQQAQMEMQQRHFADNLSLQMRQAHMQRQWAREDWGFQDMTRAMQWGWRQEDFAENVRFMTGRQRRLAERGMERETIMFNLESGQIDTQRSRQEELWALEDQRFALQKAHQEEQRKFQEENLEMQRKFFEERKAMELESRALQEESIALNRQYQLEQQELQRQSLILQEEYMENQIQNQKDMMLLSNSIEDAVGNVQLLKEKWEEVIETMLDSYEILGVEFKRMVQSIIDGTPYVPSYRYGNDYGAIGPGDGQPRQEGGDMFAGMSYIIGERKAELMRPGMIGSVVNQYDVAEMQGQREDKWETRSVFYPTKRGTSDGGSLQPINVYLGNELIGSYVIDTVKRDLEVL